MGKDLKGKELGKGISQRADGRYIARFTSKTGKRKTLYDFKLNELKQKLREAVYEDEHGLNGNGESITLNAWYVTWTELYKKKTVKMTKKPQLLQFKSEELYWKDVFAGH